MSYSKKNQEDHYKCLESEDPVSGTIFFDQVLDRFGIDLNDVNNQVLINWSTIVGEDMAKHVKCEKISKGTLYLICDHPSRASYVKLSSSELKKKINGIYPEIDIKKIIARVGNKYTT